MCPWALSAPGALGTVAFGLGRGRGGGCVRHGRRAHPLDQTARPPPGTEKWLTALHWLGLLRTAYSEPQLGNAEAQRRAETFFDECNHLRYWLKEDIGGLARVTQAI